MKPFVLVTCVALLGCGTSERSVAHLELALEEGTVIHALSGQRTEVMLVVLGADGRDVSFGLGAAPPFVSISGAVLVVAPERTVAPDSFEVEITATAGAEVDTKTVRVVVERTNTIPQLRSFTIVDVRGGGIGGPPDAPAQCLSEMRVLGSLFETENEQDPARVEVELVRDGESFTGVPTSTSEWLARRYGGPYMDYDYVVSGVSLGQVYRVAVRGADALGGATEWLQYPTTVVCMPFALPHWARGYSLFVDPLCTSRGVHYFDIDGVLPGPAQVEVVGLPNWATVSMSGSTITVTMNAPADIAEYTRFPIELRVTSGGFTAANMYYLFKC